jgi:Mrp family chromosome partitioning ATPase
LPPIIGLAEPIRLAMAADSIALVIRWGRTERQLVEFALDALRRASVSTITVILNDIDLKAQQRRGFRDHALVYADEGLYQATVRADREPAPRAPSSVIAADPNAHSEPRRTEPQYDNTPRDRSRSAGSDIERLYDRYHH